MATPKRPATAAAEAQVLQLRPLGAGQEVGRSCIILRYKGLTVMLDCGVLPKFTGRDSLPYLDEINPADIDVVIITHFHLDHCAALPYFSQRLAGFRGRIYATYATIAVMRLLLKDFVRVASTAGAAAAEGESREGGGGLYDEADVDACLGRMQPVNLHSRVDCGRGATLTLFPAGHVLGAAMVQLEIAGVKVLYTGDYSCEEDRHLDSAEVPKGLRPDVLIVEATYGVSVHEPRIEREARFTGMVEKVVRRGGRCLIPVFALGRAQELLLILEELWASQPDLQRIPIYYASKMAENALEVYRTYKDSMNAHVRAAERNPWDFQFIKNVKPRDFHDVGPCVVLAAPGMMQSGFSRALFDKWAEDPRNGVVLSGYSTEGSLARILETNPTEVESAPPVVRKLTRRCDIERVSFAAHADSDQTVAFVDALRPAAIMLVHGERNEMGRLRGRLAGLYGPRGSSLAPGQASWLRDILTPGNNQAIEFSYTEAKVARVMGRLAEDARRPGAVLTGVLVSRHFENLLLHPLDLPRFTQLSTHTLGQTLHVPYRSSFGLLVDFVTAMYEGARVGDEPAAAAPPGRDGRAPRKTIAIAGGLVTLTHAPPDRVVISWDASPQADMIADSLVCVISQAGASLAAVAATSRPCSHGGAGGDHVPHDEGTGRGCCDAAATGGATPAALMSRGEYVWASATPWARALLSSDAGPLSGGVSMQEGGVLRGGGEASGASPVEESMGVVSAGVGGGGDGAVPVVGSSGGGGGVMTTTTTAASTLLPLARRRQEVLMSQLSAQYGASAVVAEGGEGGHFSVTVTLDTHTARISYEDGGSGGAPKGGFSISLVGGQGGGADVQKWLSALARTTDTVAALLLPLFGSAPATSIGDNHEVVRMN